MSSTSYSSYASSQASCSDHQSSAPSSVHSQDDCDDWQSLQHQTDDFVLRLLKEKRETGAVLRAWSVRCMTLEEEVARLAALVDKLESEAKEVDTLKSQQEPCATPATNSNPWGPIACRHSNSSSPVPSQKDDFSTPSTPITRPSTPQIDPTKSMSKQDPPPCNSYYLVGGCSVPRCKFSHLYKLTTPQLEEMRRGAKFHLCNALKNNVECDDPTCCYGHMCPRGSACGRNNCAFNDVQHRGPPAPPTVQPAPGSLVQVGRGGRRGQGRH